MENKQSSTLLLQYKQGTNDNRNDEEILQDLYNKYHTKYKGNIGYIPNLDYETFKDNYTQPLTIDNTIKKELEDIQTNLSDYDLRVISAKKPLSFFEYYDFEKDLKETEVSEIVEKVQKGIRITPEERQIVQDYNIAKANIVLRGVGRWTGYSQAIKDSVVYSLRALPAALTAKAIGGALGTVLGGPIGTGIGLSIGAYLQYKISTLTMPDKIEEQGAVNINNRTWSINDKGEIFFKKISDLDRQLEKDKGRIEVENENIGEAAIDAVLGVFGAVIPKGARDWAMKTTAVKFAQAINKYTKIPGTTVSGFLNEHLEEIFTDFLGTARGIDDRDLKQILEEYPLIDSSMVILGSGGLMYGINSLAGKALKRRMKDRGIDQDLINSVDNLTEIQKDSLLSKLDTIETQEEEIAFNNELKRIEQQAIDAGVDKKVAEDNTALNNAVISKFAELNNISRIDVLNKLNVDITNDAQNIGGENSFNQFIGEQSGYLPNSLNKAKQLSEQGLSNENIRQQTGWFKGIDNKWRYEINDKNSTIKEFSKSDNLKLRDILDFDELFNIYPFLQDVKIEFNDEGYSLTDPSTNTIDLSNNFDKATLLHEIQHLIQSKEGFVSGTTPQTYEAYRKAFEDRYSSIYNYLFMKEFGKDFYDEFHSDKMSEGDFFKNLDNLLKKYNITEEEHSNKSRKIRNEAREKSGLQYLKDKDVKNEYDFYNRFLGEVEARNVENRSNLTEQERKNTPIENTQDVRNNDAIVIFNNGVVVPYNTNDVNNQSINNIIRGSIKFDGNKAIINLVKGNFDNSTLTHEFSHYYLKLLETMSQDGSKQIKEKYNEVLKIFTDESIDKGDYYSTQEKFARSWEAYLKRGIAPTNKLKEIFDDFKKWLLDIYKSFKDLKIDLSNDAINFFDNLLTESKTLDEVQLNEHYQNLQNDIDKERNVLFQQGLSEEEIDNRINDKYGERLQKIEEAINNSTNSSLTDSELNNYLKEENKHGSILDTTKNIFSKSTDWINNVLFNQNQNIREISEDIYQKYIDMTFKEKQETLRVYNSSKEFIDGCLKLLKENKEEYRRLNALWYANDVQGIANIASKYGFYEGFLKVRENLETIRENLLLTGVDVPYRENYLPTKVKPGEIDNLREAVSRKYGKKLLDDIDRELLKAGIDKRSEAAGQIVNNYLRGFGQNGVGLGSTKFNKQRVLKREAEFFPYYQDFLTTYSEYVTRNINNIEERKFFGKVSDQKQKLLESLKQKEKLLKETNDNLRKEILNKDISEIKKQLKDDTAIEENVGSLMLNIKDKLTQKQQRRLTENLISLFNKKSTGKVTSTTNALSGIYVLANFKSSLKQIQELGNSMYKNGYANTFTSIANVLFNKNSNTIDVKDLGFDAFENLTNADALQRFYKESLKYTGFETFDNFSKNVFLNSTIEKARNLLKKNDISINKELELMFDEKASQVKEDILNHKNSVDVLGYAFSKLNDTQPITQGAKTKFFNDNPSLRWAYNLKGYLVQQLSMIKNDIYSEAKKGNFKKAAINAIKLQTSLWISGVPISMIAHYLFDDDDEDYNIADALLDNIVVNNIINRFNLAKLATGKLGDLIYGFLTPAIVRPLNYLGQDAVTLFTDDDFKNTFIKNSSIYRSTKEPVKKVLDIIEN